MAKINETQYIILDVMNHAAVGTIYAKQGDINRIVKFKIVNAGKPVDISKLDAVINIKKPDKTVIISNLDKDKRNNLLVFSFGNNATVKSGEIEYDILLTEQGAAISTVTGKMIVAKKVVQDGDIKSSNEFNALVCALEKVTHIPEIDDDNISKDTTWSSDQIVQCIKDGGFGKIDDELSAESENPVKNKAIYEKIYQYFLDNAVYPINLIVKDLYKDGIAKQGLLTTRTCDDFNYATGEKVLNTDNNYDDSISCVKFNTDIGTVELKSDLEYPFVVMSDEDEIIHVEHNEHAVKGNIVTMTYCIPYNAKYIYFNYYKDEINDIFPTFGKGGTCMVRCKASGLPMITYWDKDYYEEHGAVDVGDLSQQVEKCNIDIETLKKSVSDGKILLADAITEKGIKTASDDTFKLMAEKIKQIQSVGYGMYGKVDTTIASNGTVRYIYGTCTIEQEGE